MAHEIVVRDERPFPLTSRPDADLGIHLYLEVDSPRLVQLLFDWAESPGPPEDDESYPYLGGNAFGLEHRGDVIALLPDDGSDRETLVPREVYLWALSLWSAVLQGRVGPGTYAAFTGVPGT